MKIVNKIRKVICAIWGHKQPKETLELESLYSVRYTKDDNPSYIYEGQLYTCSRCRQMVFTGKGFLTCQLMDLYKAALKDFSIEPLLTQNYDVVNSVFKKRD